MSAGPCASTTWTRARATRSSWSTATPAGRSITGELAKALSGSYRVVVPDHIGCGLSSKPGDELYDYTLKSRVDDLESLLEPSASKERITLVLHDWGGMIGMGYAARHPERIRRLVILNTAAFPLPAGKSLPWRSEGLPQPAGRAPGARSQRFRQGRHPHVLHAQAHERGAAAALPRALRLLGQPHRGAALRGGHPPGARGQSLRPGGADAESLTQFQDRPMLICWGGKDFVFDRHFLGEWRRRFPKAEVHRFADAGHYVLEDAADEIIPLVKDFLAQHPLAA